MAALSAEDTKDMEAEGKVKKVHSLIDKVYHRSNEEYKLVNLLSLVPDLNLKTTSRRCHKGKRITGKPYDSFE